MRTSMRLQWIVVGLVAVASTSARGQATVVEVAPRVAEAPVVAAEAIPEEVALAGQVIRTKQVEVRGSSEKILVALVETGDARRQIAELGPTANFKLTPIHTGDQIAVRGVRATLGNHDVLLATQVNVGGESVVIKRVVPAAVAVAQAVPAGYPVTDKIIKIDGRIEHLRTSRLRGTRAEHLIAEVVTRNARAIVVDLGPPSALWRADVRQGEWITIQGQQMDVNNRPVLLALEINKSGVPHLIDRHLVRDQPTDSGAVIESAAVVDRAAVVAPAAVGERQIAP
jgi:hypothetical protein